MPSSAGIASVTDDLRTILAALTGRDELLHIPPGTPLFGEAVALDSLTGTLLLREIQRRYAVDVAGEDPVMAATLLLIKAFSLLPHPPLADPEGVEELKRRKRGVENEARMVAIYLGRQLGGRKHEEIGKAVGRGNASSVSSAYLLMKERVAKERRLGRRVRRIEEALVKSRKRT